MNHSVEDSLKVRINSYHAITLFVNVEDLLLVISQIKIKTNVTLNYIAGDIFESSIYKNQRNRENIKGRNLQVVQGLQV